MNLIAQTSFSKSDDSQTKELFGGKVEHLNEFKGEIYYLPKNTKRLPDYSQLKPKGEIYTSFLNIQDQDFAIGFPGVTDRFENFGVDYKGKFYLKTNVNYCFFLASDDGSQLFIDDYLIINNDGQHSYMPMVNCLELSKGFHDIEVKYFQGPRLRVALVLGYKKIDDSRYKVFDLRNFSPVFVEEQDSTINISIGSEILFEFNSFELSQIAKETLGNIKRLVIDKASIISITIEGHTDDIGNDDYNMALSLKRANAVNDYFTSIGVSAEYLKPIGFGKSKPKVPNTDDASRKQNRRIELTILKN
jgi:outer membrane protein OmpA-like peptidoglycan-associated protein